MMNDPNVLSQEQKDYYEALKELDEEFPGLRSY